MKLGLRLLWIVTLVKHQFSFE
uniref:Uncharacterized protein n=1 Tax=Anguilla anguilla TaxID=7936 RepID=A0A0E9XJK4_ANGAN